MSFAADKTYRSLNDAPPSSFVFSAGNASENPNTPSPGGNQTWTFVFTDIAQSSVLWRTQPNAMETALAWHDDLLVRVAQTHHGVVFKTVGDGAYLAFSNADDALRMACDAQAALHARFGENGTHPLPLRVRFALHSGAAQTRNDDFFGFVLSQTARLLTVLHGGQIVLSQVTAALAQHNLAPGVSLLELGAHPLRDFDKPEILFQAVGGDFPLVSDRLRTEQSAPPHNLPRQLSSFVGREKEVGLLKRSVATNRLVTLTGAGGSGKTRLSIQVAESLAGDFEHGTFFVDLSPLTDAALITAAVAQAVGVPAVAGQSTHDTLLAFLQTRAVLLILDNCEHLIEACARFADALLRACSKVHVLATSREALGIWGEFVWPVPPLGLPPNQGRTVSLQKLHTFEAVRLFVERAQSQNPMFQLSPNDAPHIVRLCHVLDGIPLALEIAASRAGVLSPEQIAERLGNLVKLLKAENTRLAQPRQKTLRATIDWSYNLLTPDEQKLLRRLSVFAGGWTLEAAEAVCEDDSDAIDVYDGLHQLAKKSLIVVDYQPSKKTGTSSQTSPRHRMLETIRQFAQEALAHSGEAEQTAQKHQAYFADFAQAAEPHLRGSDQKAWLDKLEADHDNFRAALGLTGNSDAPLRIAGALGRFWLIRGYLTEGRRWLTALCDEVKAASVTEDAAALYAKAFNAAGFLAMASGDLPTAHHYYEKCLGLYKKNSDAMGLAIIYANLGIIASQEKRFDDAVNYLEQSVTLFREQNANNRLAMTLSNLGGVLIETSQIDAAKICLSEALSLQKKSNDVSSAANTLHNLAEIHRVQNQTQEARGFLQESLSLRHTLGDKSHIAETLCALARIEISFEQWEDATTLYSVAEKIRDDFSIVMQNDAQQVEEKINELRNVLGANKFNNLWEAGRTLPLHDAIAIALQPKDTCS